MTVVIGTAGHIDHGKTSLLRALTGIDADRLPEERRRGMTIDVGYAGRAAEVVTAVGDLLGRTTLDGSPVMLVSSTTGAGLDDLLRALEGVRDAVQRGVPTAPGATPPVGLRTPRLAVDRAFSVRGRGTVVTGTLRGGPLALGDALRLEPAGNVVRARELQVHGAPVGGVPLGRRGALHL